MTKQQALQANIKATEERLAFYTSKYPSNMLYWGSIIKVNSEILRKLKTKAK
jgi:hypothetical protein